MIAIRSGACARPAKWLSLEVDAPRNVRPPYTSPSSTVEMISAPATSCFTSFFSVNPYFFAATMRMIVTVTPPIPSRV